LEFRDELMRLAMMAHNLNSTTPNVASIDADVA